MQIYFPNQSLNTMMSSALDGGDIRDIRKDIVVNPSYRNIISLVYYKNVFIWTNGTRIMKEDKNVNNGMFYHNSLLFFEPHYSAFNLYRMSEQPSPVPHSPPDNLQTLFTDVRANISWAAPRKLNSQGMYHTVHLTISSFIYRCEGKHFLGSAHKLNSHGNFFGRNGLEHLTTYDLNV